MATLSYLSLIYPLYSCMNLIGGNSTAWSRSSTGYQYMQIDRAGR